MANLIDQIQIVSVPVGDQERARDFYVDALGFELRADETWGEGMRWVEVAPEGSATSLTLVTWFESMPPGSLHVMVPEYKTPRAKVPRPADRGRHSPVRFGESLRNYLRTP